MVIGVGIGRAAADEFLGDPLASVERLPLETNVVATIDLLSLRGVDRLERFQSTMEELIDVFAADEEFFDFDDLEFEELEIEIERDVLPWIGRSVAFGVMDAVGDEDENPIYE